MCQTSCSCQAFILVSDVHLRTGHTCRESNGLHLIVEMLSREPVHKAAISAVLLIKVGKTLLRYK